LITQSQAFLWGVKAARGRERVAFNPFSNSVARAAWQNGYDRELSELREEQIARLAS
jgi:hypothetical protein